MNERPDKPFFVDESGNFVSTKPLKQDGDEIEVTVNTFLSKSIRVDMSNPTMEYDKNTGELNGVHFPMKDVYTIPNTQFKGYVNIDIRDSQNREVPIYMAGKWINPNNCIYQYSTSTGDPVEIKCYDIAWTETTPFAGLVFGCLLAAYFLIRPRSS